MTSNAAPSGAPGVIYFENLRLLPTFSDQPGP
jgi:hypothetical protein